MPTPNFTQSNTAPSAISLPSTTQTSDGASEVGIGTYTQTPDAPAFVEPGALEEVVLDTVVITDITEEATQLLGLVGSIA